ncbi:MAG TPA: isoprenylcysteine carboxylmethyltransferase family protein [Acetobacteraceae bacterium]|nr:isoprenylcysteine carboxylmethyltransferase family protein [Acetobacteraceae bacterium]
MTPKPRLVAMIWVSTLAWLGVAAIGWGGIGPFLANPARLAVVLITLALAGVAMASEGNLSRGEQEDRGNRWVITAIAVLGLIGAWLPAWTDRHGILVLDGETLRWIGVAIYAAGGVLRLWPVFILGRRFSGLVAIQPGHTLVTTGIYGVIRHPSYLGLLTLSLGWGLAFRALAGVLLAALTVWPIAARIRAEERLLRSRFGAEYEAYCARTARLIPGVW